MSPRPYNLGKRKAAADETRGRIIEAARRLLSAPGGVGAFTIDAVAREAGVARMTVYYQYGSKAGLLDALYDDLAARGLVPALASVFQPHEPSAAFTALVDVFCGFWAGDRVITRRLRALARLDPVVDEGIRTRDEWRRGHFARALERIRVPELLEAEYRDLLDTVLVTTSFESFDQLAEARGEAEASRLTLESVQALLVQAGIRLPIGH